MNAEPADPFRARRTMRIEKSANAVRTMLMSAVIPAVASDGTIYAADSRDGSVFVAKRDAGELATLIEAGSFAGANGVAVADDQVLFVAHATGVVRIDRATGAFTPARANDHRTSAAAVGSSMGNAECSVLAEARVTGPLVP